MRPKALIKGNSALKLALRAQQCKGREREVPVLQGEQPNFSLRPQLPGPATELRSFRRTECSRFYSRRRPLLSHCCRRRCRRSTLRLPPQRVGALVALECMPAFRMLVTRINTLCCSVI